MNREKKKAFSKIYLQKTIRIGEDRYRIDDFVDDNGIVVTYHGYDTFRNRTVVIRELFPRAMVERSFEHENMVMCKRYADERYFSLMKDHMMKKAKKLIGLYPVDGIANIITCFEERGTLYVIEEMVRGQTMEEFYYKRHSAKYTIEDLMKIMASVMQTLSFLHQKGMVHGAVYPGNILLAEDGKVVLTSVVSPIEDIAYEGIGDTTLRKDGYSPVELYLPQAQKGPATDIYEVAAIFYRYVTGDALLAYYLRINEEDKSTQTPGEMKLMIMQHQADAIMKALSIYAFDRYQTMEAFYHAIWTPEDAANAKQPDGIIVNQKPFLFDQKEKKKRNSILFFLVIVVIGLSVSIPAFVQISQKMKVTGFYEHLLKAQVEEQINILLSMDQKQRKTLTNDYLDMDKNLSDEELSEQFEAKYYDLIVGRTISHKELNQRKKIYDYIRIDYRKNEIWMTHMGKDVYEQKIFSRKARYDGTYEVSYTYQDESGNMQKEILFVKP